MSPFHAWTPISTKFRTDLPANSGKVLNTSMTPPTRPPDTGYPKLQNLNWSLEKKLSITKKVQMDDVSSSNFSRANKFYMEQF